VSKSNFSGVAAAATLEQHLGSEQGSRATYCRIVAPRWKRRLGRDYGPLSCRRTNSRRAPPWRGVRCLRRRCWIGHQQHRNRAVLSIPGTADGAAHGPHSSGRGPTCPRCPSLQHLQREGTGIYVTIILIMLTIPPPRLARVCFTFQRKRERERGNDEAANLDFGSFKSPSFQRVRRGGP